MSIVLYVYYRDIRPDMEWESARLVKLVNSLLGNAKNIKNQAQVELIEVDRYGDIKLKYNKNWTQTLKILLGMFIIY